MEQLNFDAIVNGVRSRKRCAETPSCPVCGCTVRPNELEAHLAVEVERLNKIHCGKRKLSVSVASTSSTVAGPSGDMEGEVDVAGSVGADVYLRVKRNRVCRLRGRRSASAGECPVCGVRMSRSRLGRHAVRCLRRTGAPAADDEYVPETSSDEEGSIDVENDGGEGGAFGAEYRWCGQWRVRAAALAADALDATPVRRASTDSQLVVDGDDDTEMYGPAQYSPSRINREPSPAEGLPGSPQPSAEHPGAQSETEEEEDEMPPLEESPYKKYNDIVQASCETRIKALMERIRELEVKCNSGSENKCLICLGAYKSPAISIQCWHVYCEECWIESLRAKKLCPQCNVITATRHLRRIYM